MAEVVGGEPGHLGVRREGLDDDPLVPLDLADGGPQHIDERDRAGVVVVVLGAREDQQVLAVAADDRGHVVELEERGELVRVLLALLQALDDAELALDQAEAAQPEVDEGVLHGAARPLQLGGQLPYGVGQFGPFDGESGLALAGLVELRAEGVGAGRVFAQPVVERVERPYGLGELVVAAGEADRLLRLGGRREPGRAAPQHGERPGQTAGAGGRDTDGEQQQRADECDPQLKSGHVVVAQCLEPLHLGRGERRLGAAHPVDPRGERGGDLVRAQLAVGRTELGLVGEAGEIALGGGHVRAGHVGGELLARGGGGLLVEVGERGLLAHPRLLPGGAQRVPGAPLFAVARVLLYVPAGDRVVDRGGGLLRHRERGDQQAPGGGGLFDGAAEVARGAGGLGGARGRPVGQFVGEAEQLGDHVGVRAVRLQGGALAGEGGAAQRGDGGQVAAEGRGRGGSDLVDAPVDAGGAVLEPGVLARVAAARDVRGDVVAFVGEGVGQGDGLLVQLGQGDQALGLVEVRGGGEQRGGARPQDGERDHGDRGDQPGPYAHGARGARGVRGALDALAALAPRPLVLHRCSQS